MSTAARAEAIAIVAFELERLEDDFVPMHGFAQTRMVAAGEIVDRLLETHAIVRRAPRAHRVTSERTRSVVERVLGGGPR